MTLGSNRLHMGLRCILGGGGRRLQKVDPNGPRTRPAGLGVGPVGLHRRLSCFSSFPSLLGPSRSFLRRFHVGLRLGVVSGLDSSFQTLFSAD